MKLWLLRPVEGLEDQDNPWRPWYDKAFGFVVRADSEEAARRWAMEKAGEETQRWVEESGECKRIEIPAWTDAHYSTCIPLLPDGQEGIVLCDYALSSE